MKDRSTYQFWHHQFALGPTFHGHRNSYFVSSLEPFSLTRSFGTFFDIYLPEINPLFRRPHRAQLWKSACQAWLARWKSKRGLTCQQVSTSPWSCEHWPPKGSCNQECPWLWLASFAHSRHMSSPPQDPPRDLSKACSVASHTQFVPHPAWLARARNLARFYRALGRTQ